jgi:hypothetical protein
LGIATGRHSFDVLDVDVKENEDGNKTLADFEKKHGRLPETVEQTTGGGGRQLLFMAHRRVPNSVKFAPGLDTRADGGLIVAPPSLHVSGKRYEWKPDFEPFELPLATWPGWLLKLIENHSGSSGGGKKTPGWQFELLKGVPEGQRTDTATRLAGRYFGKRLEPLEVFYLLCRWDQENDPPLEEDEIRKIVENIGNRDKQNRNEGHGEKAAKRAHRKRIKLKFV